MAGSRRLGLTLGLALGCGAGASSDDGAPPAAASRGDPDAEPTEASPEVLARLAAWERQLRERTDFAATRPWSERAGVDPFLVEALPDGSALGLLRGAGTIVRFDADDGERGRVETFVDATGWARTEDALWVVGPRQGRLWRYAWSDDTALGLRSQGQARVGDAVALRSIAIGPQGRIAVGDPVGHRVLLVDAPGEGVTRVEPQWSAACGMPLALRWAPGRLLALCMLDHALLAWALDGEGRPRGAPQRVEHDGPLWSMDVRALPDSGAGPASPPALRVALGGVEDHPLDRRDGGFGYVDSFVFVVDLPPAGAPVRRAMVNVSEHGAITPKWVALRVDDQRRTTVWTAGYGGDALLALRWGEDLGAARVDVHALVPGITDAWISDDGRRGLAADPLLDAWVRWDDEGVHVRSEPDARPVALRVGEALAFTGLLAPAGTSQGKRSRFTCETCHFEGGVDGRVHFTGRQDVHASTRPLRGLFENRPHFSRALDRTMATMVDNEFGVANHGTTSAPWFSVSVSSTPWLAHLGVTEALDGEALRRALMTFLMAYSHEPNPRAGERVASDRSAWSEGAAAFERHCERCHAARLVTDDPASRVEPSRWASLVAAGGPLVWAAERRERTGVEPYVHADGARIPSLRRLFGKRPYFTNGSAATIDEVLRGFSPAQGRHVRDDAEAPLTEAERRALVVFLDAL